MEILPTTVNNISIMFERELGISYEEFLKMDVDKQREMLDSYWKKQGININNNPVDVMVGYGEFSTFTKVNKGDKVMTRYGNFIEAGLSLDEYKRRREDQMDDICYSKPVALVKKFKRRIGKK